MSHFVLYQVDYICFLSGFAILGMSPLCLDLAKSGNRSLPWRCLGLFGLAQGFCVWAQVVDQQFAGPVVSRLLGPEMGFVSLVGLALFVRPYAETVLRPGLVRALLVGLLPVAIWTLVGTTGPQLSAQALLWATFAALAVVGCARSRKRDTESSGVSGAAWLALAVYALLVVPAALWRPACHPLLSEQLPSTDFWLASLMLQCVASIVLSSSIWAFWSRELGDGARVRGLDVAVCAVVAVILCAGFAAAALLGSAEDDHVRSDLIRRARVTAMGLDPELIAALSGSESDVGTEPFARTRRFLAAARKENRDARFVYLMRMRHGRVFFLADAEDVFSPDYSPPGQVYAEASDQLVESFQTGRSFVDGPMTDSWGEWMSCAVPLTGGGSRPFDVLGVDLSAQSWALSLSRHRLAPILMTLMLCFAVASSYRAVRAEMRLQRRATASQQRYKALVDSSPNLIAVVDEDGLLVSLNSSGLEALGWDAESVAGRPFSLMWSDASRRDLTDAFARAATGETCNLEADSLGANGEKIAWAVCLRRFTHPAFDRPFFMAVAVDVTERKRAEEAVRQGEERFRGLVSDIPGAVYRCASDTDWTMQYLSPGIDEITGYPPEEFVGNAVRSYASVIHPDDAAMVEELISEGVRNRRTYVLEYRVLHRDGSIRWVYERGRGIFGDQGELVCLDGILLDASEKRRAEEALRLTQFTMDKVSVEVFWIGRDGRILYANEAACEALECSAEELADLTLADVDPSYPAERWLEAWAEIKTAGTRSFSTSHITKSGRVYPVEVTASYVDYGGLELVCAVSTDITERVQSEQRLARLNQCMLSFGTDPEENIGRLVEACGELLGADMAGYVRLEGGLLRAAGVWNYPEDAPSTISACDSISYEVILDAKDAPYVTHNTGQESSEEKFTFLVAQGIRTYVGQAVKCGGSAVGAVCAGYRAHYEPTEEDARILGIIASAVGVEEERRRDQLSLRMQTSAINAATDQVIITDAEGYTIFVNPAFERETGFSLDEVAGRRPGFLDGDGAAPDVYRSLWSTIVSGGTWQGEVTTRSKDGRLCDEDVTVTPVRGRTGTIESFIAIKRNITERKKFEEQLDHLAHHDDLTGLPNRLMFGDQLTQSLLRARREERSIAILFLDLDRFKFINDSLGHGTGDLLLQQVADRLRVVLRESDVVARMGGDEFTMILEGVQTQHDAGKIARKILRTLTRPFYVGDRELFVTVSIGISLYPLDGHDVETLVKNADTAMYRAKEQGRNNYQLYTESLNAAVLERIDMETSLRKALERNEFELHYQPRISIGSGAILGVEALLRWRHPELGMVAPAQFISIAEETGLIVPISEWVLRTACACNKAWQDRGLSPLDVAVNISASHFQRGDLVASVEKVLNETGLDPRRLTLELTESMVMTRPDAAILVLGTLKEMGVQVSIDDFGTGYSSLSYLKRLPIDAVKIDQSFVRDITTNSDDAAIAAAVVAMAHRMRLTVTAEGVETVEQLEFLRSIDCDEIQGYFVSRPVPAQEIEQILRDSLAAGADKARRAA